MASHAVIDQAADLLRLYDRDIYQDASEPLKTIQAHYNSWARVGFETEQPDALVAANCLIDHIKVMNNKEMAAEKGFISSFIAQPLYIPASQGLDIVLSHMPEMPYPQLGVVLVLAGDQPVMQQFYDEAIGINLNMIYAEVKGISHDGARLSEATDIFKSHVMHGSSYCYLDQVKERFPQKMHDLHWLYPVIFREGFATYVETRHHPNHSAYMRDIEIWQDALHNVAAAAYPSDFRKALREIRGIGSLTQNNPKGVETIDQVLAAKEPLTPYKLLEEIFILENGPVNEIGYAMWKTVADKCGAKEVKDAIKKGPAALVENYQRVKN